MTAGYKRFLRIVTGTLGILGVVSIVAITYELFFSFSVWRLLLVIFSIPGAAAFLFFALHREHGWSGQGFGGPCGTESAFMSWPKPSKPPALSAGAAVALPRGDESS